jgi:hypothetical protein
VVKWGSDPADKRLGGAPNTGHRCDGPSLRIDYGNGPIFESTGGDPKWSTGEHFACNASASAAMFLAR